MPEFFFFLFKEGDIIFLNCSLFFFNCDVAPPELTSPELLMHSQAPVEWRTESRVEE